MADSEKDVQGGIEILARLKLDAANLVRDIANLEKRGIAFNVKPTADQTAVRKVIDEISKIKFDFSGILKANSDLRTMEAELRNIVVQSEKAGQSISIALSAAEGRGGRTYKISSKDDIGPVLASMQTHRGELQGVPIRASVSGAANDKASLESATGSFKNITEPSKEAGRELKGFAALLKDFSEGGSPRRFFAPMFTRGLQGMGMGEGAAEAMGGIGGMLAGSMMFRIGWQAMEALEKIPQAIASYVAQNQALDVGRAALLNPSLPGELSPIEAVSGDPKKASQDAAYLLHLGILRASIRRLSPGLTAGSEAESVLATLVGKSAITLPDSLSNEQRAAMLKTREAANYEFTKTAYLGQRFAGGGDPLNTANALRLLNENQDPSAAMTLLGDKELMKRMVNARRDAKLLGPGFTNETIANSIRAGVTGEYGLGSPSQDVRKATAKSLIDAYTDMVNSKPAVAAFQTAIQQIHPFDRMTEEFQSVLGTKETLTRADLSAMESYKRLVRGGASKGAARVAVVDQNDTWLTRPYFGMGTSPITVERMKELAAYADAQMGDAGKFMGKGAPWKDTLPLGNVSTSFSSISGFANKMQQAGGIYMDVPNPEGAIAAMNAARPQDAMERTAALTEKIEGHLKILVDRGEGLSTHPGNPSHQPSTP